MVKDVFGNLRGDIDFQILYLLVQVGNSQEGSVEVDEGCYRAARSSDAFSSLQFSPLFTLISATAVLLESVFFLLTLSKVNRMLRMKQSSN